MLEFLHKIFLIRTLACFSRFKFGLIFFKKALNPFWFQQLLFLEPEQFEKNVVQTISVPKIKILTEKPVGTQNIIFGQGTACNLFLVLVFEKQNLEI